MICCLVLEKYTLLLRFLQSVLTIAFVVFFKQLLKLIRDFKLECFLPLNLISLFNKIFIFGKKVINYAVEILNISYVFIVLFTKNNYLLLNSFMILI